MFVSVYGFALKFNMFMHFNIQDTVSVHRPGFYAQRFQGFMAETVFKKIQSRKWYFYSHSPACTVAVTMVTQ